MIKRLPKHSNCLALVTEKPVLELRLLGQQVRAYGVGEWGNSGAPQGHFQAIPLLPNPYKCMVI